MRYVLFCIAVLAGAQDQQPIFRAGSTLVSLDVVVSSNKGPVKGLTQEDFIVQDKGKPQKVAVFSVNERVAAASGSALAPGIVSNKIGPDGAQIQMPTVILFDKLNIPSAADQAVVRTKVIAALSSLRPTDRVGLYALGQRLSVVQDFDTDAKPLIEAAQRINSTGGGELDARLRDALSPQQQYDVTVRAATTFGVFQSIARRLAGIPGRKSLIWIASDFPLVFGESSDRRANYDKDLAKAVRILSDANVVLYPMDPRALTSSGSGAGTSSSTEAPQREEGGLMPGRIRGSATIQAPTGLSGNDTMMTLASRTGGKAYYNTNDIGSDIKHVLDEAQTSYTVGFYVDQKSSDGRTHDLSVKLSNKPETKGVSVFTRKNYVAEATAPRASIEELTGDTLNATGIGLMGASAPDPSKPGNHAVQIRVDIADLTFQRQGDRWHAEFDLATAPEIKGSPLVPMAKAMSLNLTDEQLKQGLTQGVVIDNTIGSPSQPSLLRVVVQDRLGGQAGSLRIPVNPR